MENIFKDEINEKAKDIAERYIKMYRETTQGVSESYLYILREGVFLGARTALEEIIYNKEGDLQ